MGPEQAELKGPRKLLRIRPETFDFELDLGLKRGQDKHKIFGTLPIGRHTTILASGARDNNLSGRAPQNIEVVVR